MPHWAEEFVGRKYIPGEYDCATLAQEVLRTRFGVDLPLPASKPAVHHQVAQLDALRDELAVEINTPKEGDLVLMKCGGRLSHCGVFVVIGEVAHVLHAMRNAGQVVLHKLRELPRHNCQVASYHRPKIWL